MRVSLQRSSGPRTTFARPSEKRTRSSGERTIVFGTSGAPDDPRPRWYIRRSNRPDDRAGDRSIWCAQNRSVPSSAKNEARCARTQRARCETEKRSGLQRREVLHGLQGLRDIVCGRNSPPTERGNNLAVLANNEGHTVGEAVVNGLTTRIVACQRASHLRPLRTTWRSRRRHPMRRRACRRSRPDPPRSRSSARCCRAIRR